MHCIYFHETYQEIGSIKQIKSVLFLRMSLEVRLTCIDFFISFVAMRYNSQGLSVRKYVFR
jgi:hypothetical protein